MMPGQASPQGIEAILAALAGGGAPMGNMGKLPSPVNPLQSPNPAMTAAGGMVSPAAGGAIQGQPGAQQTGAMDPLQGAMGELDPQLVQALIQALLAGGNFNMGQPVVG